MSDYNVAQKDVISELEETLGKVDAEEVNKLIEEIEKADKVFFVAVGRVLLSLQSVAKRLAHLGVDCHIVGEITEPAITEDDLLIVGSGSGETTFPVAIAEKAKKYNATVFHIGRNPDCSMDEFSDFFVRIPASDIPELPVKGVESVQPMTSLFEQALLLLGDTIALMMAREMDIEMEDLWEYHANLE
ncbi:putative sugar phosphate isomerase involved in capsule formation [Halobacteroides halobius DSM 5150]|uniref:Putative sugar phosphate isomerase involved in capsule formation n=1 Tax=Halobacteroides halobius (strain ATCC 35273 / DSM 5150 / MD-1) TaxID=748449 RepID=L0KCC2_HALHC|nr:6-phospho-3-hexuloisomerase [Halobacteroides halobius]AGB42200.1 putative sugar phosphate isomerase involved in capsule formation [Halobacteroides halobius DSM 5150]